MSCVEDNTEIPEEVLSSPALLYLYCRVEQILGIKTTSEALIKLNEYLEQFCRASFIENPAAYEHALTSSEQIFTISKMVTINETYFFREGAHLDLLSRMLPEFYHLNRPVYICSAATSIGCEAYSIAMLLDYHSNNVHHLDFEIDAFDISAEAIETARQARYTGNSLRTDGSGWKYIMDLYLHPDDNEKNAEFVVSSHIRNKVHFFPHNIMRGFNKQYDIIFFRNALIYFTSKNRLVVMNDIAESLFNNGLLFLGVAETSVVKHPLLVSRFLSDVFYFQKTSNMAGPRDIIWDHYDHKESHLTPATPEKPVLPEPIQLPSTELLVNCKEVMAILDMEEGRPNADKTLEMLTKEEKVCGNELVAAAVYFLAFQDFDSANLVLSYLEKHDRGVFTVFLRGEHYLLQHKTKEAVSCFEQAARKDRAFWPAFYRIVSLAAEGNPTRYENKIKKAIESIELSRNVEPGRELYYECFMGGFSSDYFQRLLNQRLSNQTGSRNVNQP